MSELHGKSHPTYNDDGSSLPENRRARHAFFCRHIYGPDLSEKVLMTRICSKRAVEIVKVQLTNMTHREDGDPAELNHPPNTACSRLRLAGVRSTRETVAPR